MRLKKEGGIKMYKALDVAKYAISRCYKNGNPISNLQLQKILYYIQGHILGNLNKPLFMEHIKAWRLGPVVEEVYYNYNMYVAEPIEIEYTLNFAFKNEELIIINEQIDEKSQLGVWKLVNGTHNEDPWKEAWESHNEEKIISNESMKKYFASIPF